MIGYNTIQSRHNPVDQSPIHYQSNVDLYKLKRPILPNDPKILNHLMYTLNHYDEYFCNLHPAHFTTLEKLTQIENKKKTCF